MSRSKLALAEPPARVIESPYLTSREAMAYINGITTRQHLNDLIKKHGLPTCRAGGRLRFDKREIDVWLRDRHAALALRGLDGSGGRRRK